MSLVHSIVAQENADADTLRQSTIVRNRHDHSHRVHFASCVNFVQLWIEVGDATHPAEVTTAG